MKRTATPWKDGRVKLPTGWTQKRAFGLAVVLPTPGGWALPNDLLMLSPAANAILPLKLDPTSPIGTLSSGSESLTYSALDVAGLALTDVFAAGYQAVDGDARGDAKVELMPFERRSEAFATGFEKMCKRRGSSREALRSAYLHTLKALAFGDTIELLKLERRADGAVRRLTKEADGNYLTTVEAPGLTVDIKPGVSRAWSFRTKDKARAEAFFNIASLLVVPPTKTLALLPSPIVERAVRAHRKQIHEGVRIKSKLVCDGPEGDRECVLLEARRAVKLPDPLFESDLEFACASGRSPDACKTKREVDKMLHGGLSTSDRDEAVALRKRGSVSPRLREWQKLCGTGEVASALTCGTSADLYAKKGDTRSAVTLYMMACGNTPEQERFCSAALALEPRADVVLSAARVDKTGVSNLLNPDRLSASQAEMLQGELFRRCATASGADPAKTCAVAAMFSAVRGKEAKRMAALEHACNGGFDFACVEAASLCGYVKGSCPRIQVQLKRFCLRDAKSPACARVARGRSLGDDGDRLVTMCPSASPEVNKTECLDYLRKLDAAKRDEDASRLGEALCQRSPEECQGVMALTNNPAWLLPLAQRKCAVFERNTVKDIDARSLGAMCEAYPALLVAAGRDDQARIVARRMCDAHLCERVLERLGIDTAGIGEEICEGTKDRDVKQACTSLVARRAGGTADVAKVCSAIIAGVGVDSSQGVNECGKAAAKLAQEEGQEQAADKIVDAACKRDPEICGSLKKRYVREKIRVARNGAKQGKPLVPILFAGRTTNYAPGGQDALQKAVAYLNEAASVVVRIEGHTDKGGSPQENMGLADMRARKVKADLIAAGIDPKRLQTVSFGERKAGKKGRSNARVELGIATP